MALDVVKVNWGTIFYICGHHTEFPSPWPLKGELVLCRRCDDYRTVVKRLPSPRPDKSYALSR